MKALRVFPLLFHVAALLVGGCAGPPEPPSNVESGAGAIHLAAEEGDLDRIRQFVNSGIPVDAKASVSKATPLHFAAREGQLDVATWLIHNGANVNAKTVYDITPLHLAAGGQWDECFEHKVQREDAQGLTEGHRAMAELLIRKGAIVDARNYGGTTPLSHAASCNDLRVAELLVTHGADVNSRAHQYSVLDMAVAWGPDVVEFLLENGAEVNAYVPFSNTTPLQSAVLRDTIEVAQLLLEHGANPNAPQRGMGQTPLHTAAMWCQPEVAELLLRYGADKNVKDKVGKIPLQWANRCPDLAEILTPQDAGGD